MDTLADILEPGLRLVSVGLNPSLPSVARGFYFANPRNRFWRALNASRLLPAPVEPGAEAQAELLAHARLGFTDLVKRPTAGVAGLRAADYRRGSAELAVKLQNYAPRVVWFHGKVAYSQYLRYSGDRQDQIDWGAQPHRIGSSAVFVTPNPSPANAVYSLSDLVTAYDALADYVESHC